MNEYSRVFDVAPLSMIFFPRRLLSTASKNWLPRWIRRLADCITGSIFRDVRLYPILNLGHLWAPSFSRCFHTMMNYGPFFGPLLIFDLPQCQESWRWERRGTARGNCGEERRAKHFGQLWGQVCKLSLLIAHMRIPSVFSNVGN